MNVIIISSFLVAGLLACPYDDLDIIDLIYQEPDCSREGGMCVIATDCPEGKLTESRGLCPEQQDQGVECCYGSSVKETRCRKRGGECFERNNTCRAPLIVPRNQATDCPDDTVCRILVG